MPNALVDRYTESELRAMVSKSFCMSDLLKNLGYKCVSGRQNEVVKVRLEKYNISTTHFTHHKPTIRTEDNVFCAASSASQATLRRWYKKLFPNEICSICGQNDIWNSTELVLTLDHINGNNKDNRLENLRWICPNCDRQLGTFAGKNVKQVQ